MMRSRPGWMTLSDESILEFLSEHDLALPPKPLYHNLLRHGIDIGYSTVRKRLKELEKRGAVEKTNKAGYYEITEEKRSLLEG